MRESARQVLGGRATTLTSRGPRYTEPVTVWRPRRSTQLPFALYPHIIPTHHHHLDNTSTMWPSGRDSGLVSSDTECACHGHGVRLGKRHNIPAQRGEPLRRCRVLPEITKTQPGVHNTSRGRPPHHASHHAYTYTHHASHQTFAYTHNAYTKDPPRMTRLYLHYFSHALSTLTRPTITTAKHMPITHHNMPTSIMPAIKPTPNPRITPKTHNKPLTTNPVS